MKKVRIYQKQGWFFLGKINKHGKGVLGFRSISWFILSFQRVTSLKVAIGL